MESKINLLLHSARFGSINRVKAYIEDENVDINSTDKLGRTALHRASYGGSNLVVEYLLSKGANVNMKTNKLSDEPEFLSGATPLTYAVLKGHTNVAKTLIENGSDVSNVSDPYNMLEIAISSDSPAMIECILELGFDVNQEGYKGMTPLSLALVANKPESVKFLLDKGANYGKYTADGGFSPLVHSFQNINKYKEDIECTKLLLDFVGKKEGRDGLLDYINYNGSITGLHRKFLISLGADMRIKDKDGFLPYDLAGALSDEKLTNEIRCLLDSN